jgi:hypothetical protein
MNIAISINQQAQRCAKMCLRDFGSAEIYPERAEKLMHRIAERLQVSYTDPALGLRITQYPHPAPFEAMVTSPAWRHRIKAGILAGHPELALIPAPRLRALADAGFDIERIFRGLMSRAVEEDCPEIFEIALDSLDFIRLTSHSPIKEWIAYCTPARAGVMADFLRQAHAIVPGNLEEVLSFWPKVGNQANLSAKQVLVAEFFFEGCSAELRHEGKSPEGLGMKTARALRSNHGKISLLGRWPTLEDRLGLTGPQIKEACPEV